MWTIDDLRPTAANEFRMIGTGDFYVNRNGRRVEKTAPVEYITCKAGQMEEAEWARLMEEAVRSEGKTELLHQIKQACTRLAWLKTVEARHVYALSVLASGAYLHWPEWRNGQDGPVL